MKNLYLILVTIFMVGCSSKLNQDEQIDDAPEVNINVLMEDDGSLDAQVRDPSSIKKRKKK